MSAVLGLAQPLLKWLALSTLIPVLLCAVWFGLRFCLGPFWLRKMCERAGDTPEQVDAAVRELKRHQRDEIARLLRRPVPWRGELPQPTVEQ